MFIKPKIANFRISEKLATKRQTASYYLLEGV